MTHQVFHELARAVRGRPIIFHGLKRSGNHAVLHWIRSGGRFVFHNNILALRALLEHGVLDAQTHSLPHPVLGLAWSPKFWTKRHLVSIEDMPISRWLLDEPPPVGAQQVLLVRSPRNLFASRVKRAFAVDHPAWSRTMDAMMLRTRTLWIEHAREAAGETAYLRRKTVVLYDRFITDRSHRDAVAAALDIKSDDASLAVQASEGDGSSFQPAGARAAGPAATAELLNRDKLLDPRERELLDAVLDEPELQRLREKLFGAEPR